MQIKGTLILRWPIYPELIWWANHTLTASKPICHGNADLIFTTDASNLGWGAVCEETSTGEFGNCEEQGNHKLS